MITIDEVMPEGPDSWYDDGSWGNDECGKCDRYPKECNWYTAEDCLKNSLFVLNNNE